MRVVTMMLMMGRAGLMMEKKISYLPSTRSTIGCDDVDGDGRVDDDDEDNLPQELSRQGDTSCPFLGN